MDASKARRQSHLTASPVYESSEGGEESANDDRMGLEHLFTTCACTPSIRSQLRVARLASLAVLALAPYSTVANQRGESSQLLQRLHLHFRPAKRRKNVRVIARSKACFSP